jgi:hypothetical protein
MAISIGHAPRTRNSGMRGDLDQGNEVAGVSIITLTVGSIHKKNP